jgi:hypothetical protein
MIRLRAKVRSERVVTNKCPVDSDRSQANRVAKFPVPDSVEVVRSNRIGRTKGTEEVSVIAARA